MRVLHVTADYIWGGTESFLAALAEFRRAAPEMVPEFLMMRDGPLSGRLRQFGAPTHVLGEVRLRWPRTIMAARRRFRALLQERRFDVVVYHHYAWLPLIFADIAAAHGSAQIRWFHNVLQKKHWTERCLRLTRRNFPDLSVYNSDYLRGMIGYAGRSEVFYCAVPDRSTPVHRARVREELNTSLESPVIINVARIARGKGQDCLLQALSQLRDCEWTCWIVGGATTPDQTSYLQELQRSARSFGIEDRVSFLGPRTDVPVLLGVADIFCHPHLLPESFGISLIEALYAGLPVITSGLGGVREVLDKTCGLFTPPGDVAALVSSLRQLITRPDLRRRLGTAGPERARSLCDPLSQIRHLEDLMKSTEDPSARVFGVTA